MIVQERAMQFPDAASASRLDEAGIPGCNVDKDPCHRLLSQYEARSTRDNIETEAAVVERQVKPDDDRVPIWLQILDQESARINGDDER
jgi:hypothetical protein